MGFAGPCANNHAAVDLGRLLPLALGLLWHPDKPNSPWTTISQAIRPQWDDAGARPGADAPTTNWAVTAPPIDDFDQAVRLNPTPALPYIERGNANGLVSDFERAIQDLNRAREREATNLRAPFLRGSAYSGAGQNDKALADLEQVVKLTPPKHMWLALQPIARLGRRDEGLAAQAKAIELQPDCEMAWAARGAAYLDLGHAREAIGDLDQALMLKPAKRTSF